jgi:hypothetical protein
MKNQTNEQKLKRWLKSVDSIEIAIVTAKLLDLADLLKTDEQKAEFRKENKNSFVHPDLVIRTWENIAKYLDDEESK